MGQEPNQKAPSKAADFFEKVVDGRFQLAWFRWLEWVLITAAIFAVGKKAGSLLVQGVAYISAGLLFITGWLSVERTLESMAPDATKTRKRWPVLYWMIVLFLAAVPLVLALFLGDVIFTLIPDAE